jgi:hypothetical protein
MRKLIFVFVALMAVLPAVAQKSRKEKREEARRKVNELIRQEEEGVIAYKRHVVYGAKLMNDGYGIFLEIGRAKSVKRALLFQLEISERKDPREEKLASQDLATGNISTPFIFGKQNFLYPVKLGVQQQILLGNKSNKNGVSISGNVGGGLALGIVRPYYLEVESTSPEPKFIKYNSPDSADFLNLNKINAGPGFSRGWNDLEVNPGAYGKIGLRFDYGSYNELVSAIEVGLTAEFYSKKIPIMVRQDAKQFFYGGYVAIMFGKRR